MSAKGGCLGMLATATLFGILVDAPPGGPEGLMGLGAQLAWFGQMVLLSLFGAWAGSWALARLSAITPPPLEGELQSGRWRRHGRKAYAAGIAAGLVGLLLFGLAGFAMALFAAAFAGTSGGDGMGIAIVAGGAAGAYGAIWCGRRGLWAVVAADHARRND